MQMITPKTVMNIWLISHPKKHESDKLQNVKMHNALRIIADFSVIRQNDYVSLNE